MIFLTVSELAKRWRMPPETIRKYRRDKKIPQGIIPANNKILWPIDEIIRHEQNLKKGASDDKQSS